MIVIKNLTKKFTDVVAVNDLSITINPGINGLVGENGAGKSTLLRLISDVYQADKGEITIDDISNKDISSKKRIFFLPDNPYAAKNSTVEQTFAFYQTLFDLDKDRFDSFMKKLSLPIERKVSTFSKGMKRQFFLALALSSKADYILLDEAFDGLDPVVLDTIREEIIKDADKKTYLISSHNMSSLERLCDNFIILSKGRCSKLGDIEHIGETFVKYQMYLKEELTKEKLDALGFKVLSFKKHGSIYNVVFYNKIDEAELDKYFHFILCEKIAIDPDELITLEMLSAREENK